MNEKQIALNVIRNHYQKTGKVLGKREWVVANGYPFSYAYVNKLFGAYSKACIQAIGKTGLRSEGRGKHNTECEICHKKFLRSSSECIKYDHHFCSRSCSAVYTNTHRPKIKQSKSFVEKSCTNCTKLFMKSKYYANKHPRHFCSKKCLGTYTAAHKTTGTKVSKLEKYLQKQLKDKYKDLTFSFNKTDAISAELDIYIPSLKLAFEINGIFHYKPIFGQDNLSRTRFRDIFKSLACVDHGIELVVIDSSGEHFSVINGDKHAQCIYSIIDKKILKYRSVDSNNRFHAEGVAS